MSTFKAGDRVRVVDAVGASRQLRLGNVHTVERVVNSDSILGELVILEGGLKPVNADGFFARRFELVKTGIKVGDYVSINGTTYSQKTGTVESITPSEPVVLVRSDSGQVYARKPSELTPAVKPDPIPAEPGHHRAIRFSNSRFTWVWDDTGWSFLRHDGTKSGNNESWKSLWSRYIGPNSTQTFTVL